MKPNVHIVSYTHWDREFRWEFEHTRMKFVDCMDNLFDIMDEKEGFRSFMLDGQVGLVDDYLEIRPEQEEKVRGLIAEGRLEAGPWYSLPDCATLHGESVIRNLQYGVKVSEDYGSLLKCGYNVFSFGQIGQLPQIYGDFGIEVIIFYKYMNPARSEHPEFIWESPDGTQAYASRLGREARWNFTFAGAIPIVYDMDPWHRDWKYDYGTLGKVVHTADPEGYSFFHEIVDPETSFHEKNLEMGFERTLATVDNTIVPQSLLWFDGTDFTEPHPMTPEIIAGFQAKFGDRYKVQHSTLAKYLEELKDGLAAQHDDLAVVKGPMRDGPVGHVHTDVITTHPEIKIINAATESRLVRYAEPLSTMAWAHGIDRYPHTYFTKAWKLLFQSHAHDSVHGLGPKEIAEGVCGRMKQAGLVAQASERKALNNLSKEVKTDDQDGSTFLVLHNTAPFARSEVVEAWVDIPAEVALDEPLICELDGSPCLVQEISRQNTRGGIYHPRSRNMPYYCTRVQLLFWAENVPAMGHKTFKIDWKAKAEYPYPHEDWDKPKPIANDLYIGGTTARNDKVELTVNPDGSFELANLATGHVHHGCNHLLDAGDRGNMWMAEHPPCDAVINSRGVQAQVSVMRHGDLECIFKVVQTLRVPARYDFSAQKRSDELVDLTFTSYLSLKKDSRQVSVTSTLNNTARDHYLKVCFPTGFTTDTTRADGSFSLTEYSTTPNLDIDLARHPFQLWANVQNGDTGLALLSRSTKDYEIIQDGDQQTVAMGLQRSTRVRVPCDNRLWMEYPGDESAQSLGEYTHEYAVLVHERSWAETALYADAVAYAQPMKAVQIGSQDGCLPNALSFIDLGDSNLVFSSLTKESDTSDCIVLRAYNSGSEVIETTVTTGFDIASAHIMSLAGGPKEDLPVDGRSVKVSVRPGQIISLGFMR